VKKPFLLAILAIILAGLVILGLSDTNISITDIGIVDNETNSSISKANNSSAGATITMYAVADE